MTLNRHQPRHAGRAPFALLLGGLLGGGLILLLGLNTVSAANELRRHDLAARDEQVAASLVELRNAVAASAAPQNLALHAAEYGMVPAGNPAFLVVGESGSVRVLGSAAPASAPPVPPPPSSSSKAKAKPTTSAKPKPAKPSPTQRRAATHTPPKGRSATRSASPSPTKKRTAAPAPSPSPSTPRSTPVPTITLPGGTR